MLLDLLDIRYLLDIQNTSTQTEYLPVTSGNAKLSQANPNIVMKVKKMFVVEFCYAHEHTFYCFAIHHKKRSKNL